jgi:hypothetical protein
MPTLSGELRGVLQTGNSSATNSVLMVAPRPTLSPTSRGLSSETTSVYESELRRVLLTGRWRQIPMLHSCGDSGLPVYPPLRSPILFAHPSGRRPPVTAASSLARSAPGRSVWPKEMGVTAQATRMPANLGMGLPSPEGRCCGQLCLGGRITPACGARLPASELRHALQALPPQ